MKSDLQHFACFTGFCIVVLLSDNLNFQCAWLSGVVAATITNVVFNRNLQRRTCIVHDSMSVCQTKRLTFKYATLETSCFAPFVYMPALETLAETSGLG